MHISKPLNWFQTNDTKNEKQNIQKRMKRKKLSEFAYMSAQNMSRNKPIYSIFEEKTTKLGVILAET